MSYHSGIQGQQLEVTVVACNNLKDTGWTSRQNPYVHVEYADTKRYTRTHTAGHKNPTFQETLWPFRVTEGLRELSVTVWNSNDISNHDLIGSVRVPLEKVLSQGYDDTTWTLHSGNGRYAGEVKLRLRLKSANSGGKSMPGHPSGAVGSQHRSHATFQGQSSGHAPLSGLQKSMPGRPSGSQGRRHATFRSPSSHHQARPYGAPAQPTAYPPQPYPPAAYFSHTYSPPQQGSQYYPPGHFPGTYQAPY